MCGLSGRVGRGIERTKERLLASREPFGLVERLRRKWYGMNTLDRVVYSVGTPPRRARGGSADHEDEGPGAAGAASAIPPPHAPPAVDDQTSVEDGKPQHSLESMQTRFHLQCLKIKHELHEKGQGSAMFNVSISELFEIAQFLDVPESEWDTFMRVQLLHGQPPGVQNAVREKGAEGPPGEPGAVKPPPMAMTWVAALVASVRAKENEIENMRTKMEWMEREVGGLKLELGSTKSTIASQRAKLGRLERQSVSPPRRSERPVEASSAAHDNERLGRSETVSLRASPSAATPAPPSGVQSAAPPAPSMPSASTLAAPAVPSPAARSEAQTTPAHQTTSAAATLTSGKLTPREKALMQQAFRAGVEEAKTVLGMRLGGTPAKAANTPFVGVGRSNRQRRKMAQPRPEPTKAAPPVLGNFMVKTTPGGKQSFSDATSFLLAVKQDVNHSRRPEFDGASRASSKSWVAAEEWRQEHLLQKIKPPNQGANFDTHLPLASMWNREYSKTLRKYTEADGSPPRDPPLQVSFHHNGIG